MKQMTDKRQALPKNTVLDFGSDGSHGYSYTITDEVSRGASCIVYQAFYENSLGEKKTVYIKECCPFSLKMSRSTDGELICRDEAAFELYKKYFKEAFSFCNNIFETEGLTNVTSNYMDIHEKNGTLYTVITYRQGQKLSLSDERSLKDTIRIVKSVAKTIQKIHDNGFLYLDTKPDNIFVLDEMNESILLFDFDSMIPIDAKGDIKDYRLSFTKGFAPMEQRNGRLDLICEATDVYGVGALLFYMVFGRTPEAIDSDPFATFRYDESVYEAWRYRDRLFIRMSDFFRKTLAVAVKDRYADMSLVVDSLTELEKDADLTMMFLKDSYYPVPVGMVGREDETEKVCGFLDSDGGCLFVVGMGGIGKSTIVRSCLDKKRDEIDTVLYLYYHDSLIDTIADDRQLMVNMLERMSEETSGQYFERKLNTIRRIAENQKIVLVIDNFEGELGEEFAAIREIGWQVIIISRTDPEVEDEPVLFVNEVDASRRKELFERYLSRTLEDSEEPEFEILMEHIQGHTLAAEIIAKQVKRSILTIKQAAELTADVGFSKITDDKVAFSRDGVHNHKAVIRILSDIFRADNLSEDEKAVLQVLSLFDMPGIRKDNLIHLAKLSDRNVVLELILSGWIAEDGDLILIHPVIKEAMQTWEWNDPSVTMVRLIMSSLNKNQVDGNTQAEGGSHICREDRLTLSVLKNAKSFDKPRQTAEYYALLCKWLSDTHREEEEFLISVKDLVGEAVLYAEPVSLMNGIDFLCFVLEERHEYDDASKVLAVMEEFVSKLGDPYVSGLFNSALAQFYDACLNGAYEVATEDEAEIFSDMIDVIESSVYNMKMAAEQAEDKKRHFYAGILLLRYRLDHVMMLIRGFDGNKKTAKAIFKEMKSIRNEVEGIATEEIDELSQIEVNELRIHMLLAWAWYYTIIEVDEKIVLKAIDRLNSIDSPWTTRLDDIDFRIVPSAEMLFRLGRRKQAEKTLRIGIAICDEFEGVIPYRRKKEELLDHIKDLG